MSNFPVDLANVDWLYAGELSAVILVSIVAGTSALMLAASLVFWAHYPNDLRL
jgi:hypothetical protein